ncbi:MAG: glycosyltransferase family 4 protein [Methanomassiliicoccales archaeon]|nr:glycosyltransferase family 4 protein [Methanomassiliicoccales archaeon]
MVLSLRILVVTKFYHPRIGGVETTVEELCENFVRRGHECTVIAMDKELSGREMINGVELVRFPLDSRLLGGLNRHVWKYTKNQLWPGRYDVIHIHSYHILLSAQTAYLCHTRGIPYVFSAHYHGKGHTPVRNVLFRAYHLFGKKMLQWSEAITCVSDFEKDMLSHDFQGLEGKVTVIPSGIKQWADGPIDRSRDTILYVGRLMTYKGVDHVLRGLQWLKLHGRSVSLRVVGSGPAEQELRSLAKELGVESQIAWLGEVGEDELSREYRGAGALVLLSAAEAYGLVVAEALSCGTPAIVAKKEALVEFLSEPGCVGIDYPPESAKVGETIIGVLDGTLVRQVGPFSHKIASWQVIADEYLRFYERVVQSSRGKA